MTRDFGPADAAAWFLIGMGIFMLVGSVLAVIGMFVPAVRRWMEPPRE